MKNSTSVIKVAQWAGLVGMCLLSATVVLVPLVRAQDGSVGSVASPPMHGSDAVVQSAMSEVSMGGVTAATPGPSLTATVPASMTMTVPVSTTLAPSTTPSPILTPVCPDDAGTTASPVPDANTTASAAPDVSAPASAVPNASATVSVTATATVTADLGIAGTVGVRLLHLREGPGASYPIRGSYARDSVIQILGTDRFRRWLRVVTADDRAGWMAAENVAFTPPVAELPIVDGNAMLASEGDGAPDAAAGMSSDGRAGIPATSGVDADTTIANITDAPEGLGMIVVRETGLYVAPGVRTELVQVLREHQQVKLFGQARGAWVRVQPFTSVVPGWVYAAHLEPLPGTIPGAPATTMLTATITPTLQAIAPAMTPSPTPITVRAQPQPMLAETPVPPPARLPVEVAVAVMRTDQTVPARRGVTPTPTSTAGVRGLRVELLNVFGDVLAEAITPDTGRVVFNRDVAANTAMLVQISALGLCTQLDAAALAQGRAEVIVSLPSDQGQ